MTNYNPTNKELDLILAYRGLGRSIEEIVFCTIHPQLTGPHRREKAIEVFGQFMLEIDRIKERKE